MNARRLVLLTVLVAMSGLGLRELRPALALTTELRSTIAFTSLRDPGDPAIFPPQLRAEIYLMDADGTHQRRLTTNRSGEAFGALSPDGTRMVFDSNRIGLTQQAPPPLCQGCTNRNVSDLFVLELSDYDGVNPVPDAQHRHLTRGSSATWSPDGKFIAFHASASGVPGMGATRIDPGAPTYDSDIFVLNVDACLDAIRQANLDPTTGDCRAIATNLTHSADWIDDDPDWSPDGTKIVFTRHPTTDDLIESNQAEIYVINVDGTNLRCLSCLANPRAFTEGLEERAPDWSPDGTRLSFACRIGDNGTFETCVMNVDTGEVRRLTINTVADVTSSWSPDGKQIAVGRATVPRTAVLGVQEIFVMQADGTCPVGLQPDGSCQGQLLTGPIDSPVYNSIPVWGQLRVPDTTPPTASPTQSPVANAAGWNTSDVTVTWHWTDPGGSANLDATRCPPSSTSSGEGSLTLTATCFDLAGNQGSASYSVKVDKTAPVVGVTGVTAGASYTLGNVPSAGCSTTDALSGVATPATLAVTGGTSNGVGSFTATCSGAADAAGNSGSAHATYSVGYVVSGFLAPVDNTPTVNTGKAGRSYPVKWQLHDAQGGDVSALSAVVSVTDKATSCSDFSGDPTDALETSTTGGTSLRYDSTANQYVYNWATPAAGCYTLFLTLDSGQVVAAYFNLS
jgi:hypothetical protein